MSLFMTPSTAPQRGSTSTELGQIDVVFPPPCHGPGEMSLEMISVNDGSFQFPLPDFYTEAGRHIARQ